jgi:hypothetical protein
MFLKESGKKYLIFKVAPRGQGVNYGQHFNFMDDAMQTHEPFDVDVRKQRKQN